MFEILKPLKTSLELPLYLHVESSRLKRRGKANLPCLTPGGITLIMTDIIFVKSYLEYGWRG